MIPHNRWTNTGSQHSEKCVRDSPVGLTARGVMMEGVPAAFGATASWDLSVEKNTFSSRADCVATDARLWLPRYHRTRT